MRSGRKTAIFTALFAVCGGAIVLASPPAAGQPAPDARLGCENAGPTPATLPGAQTFVYAATPARDLRVHVFMPENAATAHPAIVFFFGGGWRTGSPVVFADRARKMASEGYVAIVPDYRVSCRDQTTANDSAADATSVHQWLLANAASLKLDTARIVLSGGSAGAHIGLTAALKAAPDQRPAALVLFNPAVDLVSIAGRINLTAETAAHVSPSVLPLDGAPPTFMVHGDADATVPIQTVRDFCARMTAAGRRCDLKEYAGKPHGFFQSRTADPALGGASPYDETLSQAIAFLKALGIH